MNPQSVTWDFATLMAEDLQREARMGTHRDQAMEPQRRSEWWFGLRAVLNALPQSASTPELHLQLAEGENAALIEKLQREARFPDAEQIVTIDGLRVEYADGFGLARSSNTTPVVVMRFEGESEQALSRIQNEFKRAILASKPDAKLPF